MCASCEFAPLAADQNEVVVLIDPDALDAPVRLAQASEIRNGDHPSFDLLETLCTHNYVMLHMVQYSIWNFKNCMHGK